MPCEARFGRRRHACCSTCAVRHSSEWSGLSDEGVTLLHGLKICNTYQPGQVIYYQANPCLGIYCVESGTIALRKGDGAGSSTLVRLANAGQTLGCRAYFAGSPYSASAEALSRCRVCFLDRAAVDRLMAHDAALTRSFLGRLARDLRREEEVRVQAMTRPVRARVAALLLLLRDHHATAADDGTLTIELPLSRRDIASYVGTRPETVARVIRQLERDGVTRFQGQRVTVPDLDALLDEVEVLDPVA